MSIVTELDLPVLDYTPSELAGDGYHERLAGLGRQAWPGWLARSPLAFVILRREPAEFFLRSRAAAFPGREIAELFGVTSGQLRQQIDANILNQQGDRHRRLRSLVGRPSPPGLRMPSARSCAGSLSSCGARSPRPNTVKRSPRWKGAIRR